MQGQGLELLHAAHASLRVDPRQVLAGRANLLQEHKQGCLHRSLALSAPVPSQGRATAGSEESWRWKSPGKPGFDHRHRWLSSLCVHCVWPHGGCVRQRGSSEPDSPPSAATLIPSTSCWRCWTRPSSRQLGPSRRSSIGTRRRAGCGGVQGYQTCDPTSSTFSSALASQLRSGHPYGCCLRHRRRGGRTWPC